jgi:uncharacterized protein (TIGR02145 family)
MADGRIWMVQNLKFGDGCDKANFSGSSSNQIGKVSSIGTYYGDCRTNTLSGAGYFYDWAAAINKADAYRGSSSDVGCSGTGSGTLGTNPGACRGICPVGWHLPTNGEFTAAHSSFQSAYNCTNAACWNASSQWEGMMGGRCDVNGSISYHGSQARWWSSSYSSNVFSYILAISGSSVNTNNNQDKNKGMSVRCVKNY